MPIALTSPTSRLEKLVRSAHRRFTTLLFIEQSALFLAVVLAGFAALLVLGTDILAVYWILGLALLGMVLAAAEIRNRRITPYRIAQTLDRHLSAHDTLSTAWFLRLNRLDDGDLPRRQIAHAEQIASSADPASAFPFRAGPLWALVAVLGVIAVSLFTARYLLIQSLSLHRSLVPLQFAGIFERTADKPSEPNSQRGSLAEPSSLQLPGPALSQTTANGKQSQNPGDSGAPGDTNGDAAQRTKGSESTSSQQRAGEQRGNSPGQDQSGDKTQQASPDQQQGQQGSPKSDKDDARPNASSLLDRMKDALSSLAAKMQGKPNQQGSPSKNQDGKQDSKESASNAAAKNEPSPQGDKDQQSNQQNTQGQGQGRASDKSANAQSKNSDQSPQKGSEAQSGIGRQDGDKALKEAEQMKAIGKLEEIIGKRSANLTGDMSIETPSGKQQLRTAYSSKLGVHSDSGGEINRDEVPIIYQQYVREYLEQVRKQQQTAKQK